MASGWALECDHPRSPTTKLRRARHPTPFDTATAKPASVARNSGVRLSTATVAYPGATHETVGKPPGAQHGRPDPETKPRSDGHRRIPAPAPAFPRKLPRRGRRTGDAARTRPRRLAGRVPARSAARAQPRTQRAAGGTEIGRAHV